MKKVILHIGQTKTATTTLQSFFYDNRSWLSRHGIYYPECPESHPLRSQHRFLVDSLARLSLPYPESVPEWDYLKDKISSTPHDTVLISEEVFWHLLEQRRDDKPDALRWIKEQLDGYDVRVICYLRRQDAWIESWYNQIVKTDVDSNSRLGFGEFVDVYRRYGMLDYYKSLGYWAEIFGKENITVRPFRRDLFFGGDIVRDFMGLMGVELDDSVVRSADKQVSLCNSACVMSNLYNRTPRALEFKQKFMALMRAYDAECSDRSRFMPRALAEGLVAEFDASNAQLAADFGFDGNIFDKEFTGYEQGEYPGLSESEVASFVMYLFQDMQGQIRALRKKVNDLEEKFGRG